MKRTFVATRVDAGENLKKLLNHLAEELRGESVKWVEPSRMHITLAFVGETSEEMIRDISAMLAKKLGGLEPFTFSLEGLGVFRSISDPRAVWAGIRDDGKLGILHEAVRSGLSGIDIPVEDRGFTPHLTLGRIKWLKNRKTLERLISEYREVQFQDVRVSEVIFYESILQPAGPLYIPIKIFRLSE
ncbi:MAG TPA: RNA 2',3'-cyclic phosphodiesterase [Bacteroidales bacterium]|nr:RNA 2',3'-cyclic phosphodiesterase [Bacteroidales bacterium]